MTDTNPEQSHYPKQSRWRRVIEALKAPQIDDDVLAEALKNATTRQPPPVVWLIGKTQSGKTSIIRTLTGSSDAEIGNGFRPCTKTARFYDFPADTPVVRFLDTRGLGEVAYDPTEDIQYCESQSHLVVAVMKASDIRQDAIFDTLHDLRRRHPEWAVLIAQTSLHELYPLNFKHPVPYPFTGDQGLGNHPGDLKRALDEQRKRLGKLPGPGPVTWIPIDFTLPEDDYPPHDYGIEAFWQAIEEASAFSLMILLQADSGVRDTYARAAHPHIVGYSLTAASVGALPVVDLALVPALQMKMLHALADLYKLQWSTRTLTEFFGLLGTTFAVGYGLKWAGRGAMKLMPGWGQTFGAVWGATASAGTTFALGKSACFYLSQKGKGVTVNRAALRSVYADALLRGRKLSQLNPKKDHQ